jgi:hypothetical protein
MQGGRKDLGGGEEFRAAIASRSLRRCPTIVTPRSLRSLGFKQNVSVDRVLAKGGFILAQTEVPEPKAPTSTVAST